MSPPLQEPRGGGEVAQVAEESEGWYRLRTVPNHWSSDEDKPHKPRNIKDSPVSVSVCVCVCVCVCVFTVC